MLLGVTLALGSAVAHAGWNTVAKRTSADGLPAIWAASLAAFVLVAPFAIGHPITGRLLLLTPVSTLLHTAYAVCLQRAYQKFDAGQIYPLSRGLAPVLVAVAGTAVLGQWLRPLQWIAVVLLGGSVALLGSNGAALWSAGIALAVAAYTTFDGWAVVGLGADPLPFYALGAALQLVFLTAVLHRRLPAAVGQFRRNARPVAMLAVLIPLSYLLGLYATRHAPLALVTALRGSSLIWAALAAALLLREPLNARRAGATVLAAAAVVTVAMAG